jgi:hypothetical protein
VTAPLDIDARVVAIRERLDDGADLLRADGAYFLLAALDAAHERLRELEAEVATYQTTGSYEMGYLHGEASAAKAVAQFHTMEQRLRGLEAERDRISWLANEAVEREAALRATAEADALAANQRADMLQESLTRAERELFAARRAAVAERDTP